MRRVENEVKNKIDGNRGEPGISAKETASIKHQPSIFAWGKYVNRLVGANMKAIKTSTNIFAETVDMPGPTRRLIHATNHI